MYDNNCPKLSFYESIFLPLEVDMTVCISVPKGCNTGLIEQYKNVITTVTKQQYVILQY